jgi:uncharacterized protein
MTSTPRTKFRRSPARGTHDLSVVHEVLDAAHIVHAAVVQDDQPFVLPLLHARVGDDLYLHGSTASRVFKALAAGTPACLTATMVDGIVLARSVFHHSMNYRSAMVLGTGEAVTDPDEKLAALEAFTEKLTPGRWAAARRPNAKELKGTMAVRFPIDEASAKVRTGGPVDDEPDYAIDVWAGVVPLELVPGAPQPDDRLPEGTAVPEHVAALAR